MVFRHVAQKKFSNGGNLDLVQDKDLEVIVTLVAIGELDGFTAPFERSYFKEQCVYGEENFERRFRMPRRIFNWFEQGIKNKSKFIGGSKDATGQQRASARIKVMAVLRILAYGMSFHQVDELCEIGETTGRRAFLSYLDVFLE